MLKVICAVLVGIVAFLLFIIFHPTTENASISDNDYQQKIINLNNLVSTVQCNYDKTLNKLCTFRNICYLPEFSNFIFLLKNESIITGLNSKNDFKTISLSSVNRHNNLFMRLQIVVDVRNVLNRNRSIVFVNEPIFLLSRFKPDNIMHVIHDDILPMFITYENLCLGNVSQCVKHYRLMFTDTESEYSYEEWYRILSHNTPYHLNSLKMLTCFDKISVGLSRETVWFQYGFGEPQGPVTSATIDQMVINRFKKFVFNSLNIDKLPVNNFINLVVLSRNSNRRILNLSFLVNNLIETYRYIHPEHESKIKVHILDQSQNKSTDIISVIRQANVLVGMHGSAMIYSLFIPENAAIVELFPFGIQPQHVSSTRAMTQLSGTFYNYLSWRNFKESNSHGHPNWPRLLGGIEHLPKDEQVQILYLKEIPAVECCHDPAYLYRMFQDTVIDESFPVILKQVLINQNENDQPNVVALSNEYLRDTWYFPGPVSDASCVVIGGTVSVKWHEPFNIQITGSEMPVSYYVTVKITSRIVTLETFAYTIAVKLSTEEHSFLETKNNVIQAWIKATINGVEGHETYLNCI